MNRRSLVDQLSPDGERLLGLPGLPGLLTRHDAVLMHGCCWCWYLVALALSLTLTMPCRKPLELPVMSERMHRRVPGWARGGRKEDGEGGTVARSSANGAVAGLAGGGLRIDAAEMGHSYDRRSVWHLASSREGVVDVDVDVDV